MRILIIRHCDPNYAIDSLTEKGWREAEMLTERLAKEKIDAYYVSPLGRAKATASLILKQRNETAEECPWLREFAPTIKDYFNCLKFLLVLMFFAFYINSMLYESAGGVDVNFMYVISPPQSGLPFLTENYGWFVYIVHYAFLVLTCLTLSYIAPIIRAIKEKLAKTEALPETETVSE